RQLIRGEGGAEPGQVLIREEKIVLIDNDADVGVGAQTGLVGPQIPGFLQLRRRRGQAARLIIGNRKLLEIVLVGILKYFLIDRIAPEVQDGMLQDSLVVSPLAAENNVPQRESKRQPDEKLGLDGIE